MFDGNLIMKTIESLCCDSAREWEIKKDALHGIAAKKNPIFKTFSFMDFFSFVGFQCRCFVVVEMENESNWANKFNLNLTL